MTAGQIAIRRSRETLARFLYGDFVFRGLNLNDSFNFVIKFNAAIVHVGLKNSLFILKFMQAYKGNGGRKRENIS